VLSDFDWTMTGLPDFLLGVALFLYLSAAVAIGFVD
jgi:hypothetical protein